jgi:membrane protein involved in D-alanine export
MTFYSDPAFFILAFALCIPAIIAGLKGRSLKTYGLIVSMFFLLHLFSNSVVEVLTLEAFMAWSCLLSWYTLRLFNREHPHAVALYRVALALQIAPLALAKLFAVFDMNLLGFIGISYLTFKGVQVLIETRDRLIKRMNMFDYLYFMLFFPVFTSGPIMRSRDFIAQINTPLSRDEYLKLLSEGAVSFIKGVVYTFLLAGFFRWLLWFAPSAIGDTTLAASIASQVAQAGAYGLYLFFDFAGYSLMALGLGACLGLRVPLNFKAPFRSIDIKDFWNRWHITLSFWLRDYVFMRLMKTFITHKVFTSRTTRACVGFVAEMTLMGAWHGLTPSCLAYGVYHGLLLAACELYQKKSKFYKKHHKKRWYRVGSWALTMVAVFFGFALFSGQVLGGAAGTF